MEPASLSQKNQQLSSLPHGQPHIIFHKLPEYGTDMSAPREDGKRSVLLSRPQQRSFVAHGSGCFQVSLPTCKQLGLEGSGTQGLRTQAVCTQVPAFWLTLYSFGETTWSLCASVSFFRTDVYCWKM